MRMAAVLTYGRILLQCPSGSYQWTSYEGGNILYEGTPATIKKCAQSITAKYI